MLGAPVSGLILKLHWLGLPWRAIAFFILLALIPEGLPGHRAGLGTAVAILGVRVPAGRCEDKTPP